MNSVQKTIMDWLRDAHAMEQQAEKMLTMFASRLENYPDLRSRIESHAGTSAAQQRLLEECLKDAGENTSAIKDLGAKVIGAGQSLSGIMVSDEVIKGVMSIYVFTQMEIVSYNIIATAAQHTGNARVLTVCNQILAQEAAMAEWLQSHIPQITAQFITRTANDSSAAKR